MSFRALKSTHRNRALAGLLTAIFHEITEVEIQNTDSRTAMQLDYLRVLARCAYRAWDFQGNTVHPVTFKLDWDDAFLEVNPRRRASLTTLVENYCGLLSDDFSIIAKDLYSECATSVTVNLNPAEVHDALVVV